MSEPTEIDFALIRMGDTAEATKVIICGIQNVTVNQGVQSSDRYVPDCAKPAAVPLRKQRITGKSLDVSGSGLTNADQLPLLQAAVGILKFYDVEVYAEDGTDTGNLLGTYSYASHMTAMNMNLQRTGDATLDVTLPSHGAWTYTAAD